MASIKLTKEQINTKMDFIKEYGGEGNAATKSELDPNANVTHKNLCTLAAELNKDVNVQVNRAFMYNKIQELFGTELADEYIRQLEEHEIYAHDETHLQSYCLSATMYPFISEGLKGIGGISTPPKHLDSYCGSFINLVYALSSQFAGACGIPEALVYFDYLARKDYGNDYLKTNKGKIKNCLQQLVYSLNQPAGSRAFQSPFTNFSVYDKNYFNAIFDGFTFPDGDKPCWDTVNKLQEFFLHWFNKEREKALLTFPVVTASILTKDGDVEDEQVAEYLCRELAEGNSFFMYMSDSADSISSCCRLQNGITDNTFSNSMGAGGVATGSINVITVNLNRIYQQGIDLEETIRKVHKYQVAYRKIMEEFKAQGMLPAYDAMFISMEKQYLTIGINGFVEAAEYLGVEISDNADYKKFTEMTLGTINKLNKEARQEYGYLFNCEMVPGESLGSKFAKWDKEAGLKVNRDCYNSYMYKVEDNLINPIEKFHLHGRDYMKYLDGGSALHLNLDEHPTKEQYRMLMKIAAQTGCPYWTTNIPNTVCKDCGNIDKRYLGKCPACGSENTAYATRVIGYLKLVDNFSMDRQKEALRRVYSKQIN
ncbi:MAG: anaerobic ribonucleoside-triphosphate reductase [Bacteroidia bacterium]|nr:anaerobic ribonucleoside-triphosphate reductase [Bacteroidia bacterium]